MNIFSFANSEKVAAIGEQGGVVFAVGVEQGRMRAMGMREGAARSEFQAVLICDVVIMPTIYHAQTKKL